MRPTRLIPLGLAAALGVTALLLQPATALARPATRHPFYWAGAMVIDR